MLSLAPMAGARSQGQRTPALSIAIVELAMLGVLAGPGSCPAAVPLRSTATHDQWNAVAVDHSGDVIAAGMSLPPWLGREQPPCSFVAARLASGSGAVLWRYEGDDCESDETISETAGERVFVDPAGDVVIGRTGHGAYPTFGVYKLAATTGEMVWGRGLRSFHNYGPFIQATTMDAAGDVVIGGGFHRVRDEPYVHLDPHSTELVVAKLESATGRELWRRTVVGDFIGDDEDRALNQVQGVAIDAKGDVFVSGVIFDRRPDTRSPDVRWMVLKLCGATGGELWRHDAGEGGAVTVHPIGSRVAVDPHGDLLAAGHGELVKLSGASGVERWRRELPGPGATFPGLGGTSVTIAPGDDVIVAGVVTTAELEGDILIVRLAGGNGAELWRRQIDGSADDEVTELYGGAGDTPHAVTIAADGSVLVAGQLANLGSHGDALVLALEGATGRERWRRVIDGGARDGDGAHGLALVDLEHVAAVGGAGTVGAGTDALAAVFSLADGEPLWHRECDGLDRAGDLPESACMLIENAPAGSPTTTSVVTTTTTTTTIGGAPVRDCRGATSARVGRQLTRARRLLARAERTTLPARKRRLLARAHRHLERAERIATRDGCVPTASVAPGSS